MSSREADAVTAGYYEDLLDAAVVRGSTPTGLVRSMTKHVDPPADWPRLHDTEGVVWDDDSYQRFTLTPDSMFSYKGVPLEVNADGYRDRPFLPRTEDGPRRIAIVGSSITMGSGVPVDMTYENLLEDSLRAEGHDIEIINLAVAGYRGTQLLDVVLESLDPLGVEAVLLVINDLTVNPRAMLHVARLFSEGRDPKYPFLADVADRAGVVSGMEEEAILERLAPFNDEVNEWWITTAVQWARDHQVPIALLIVPQPATVEPLRKRVKGLQPIFETLDVPIVSLYRSYDLVRDQSSLWIRPWDRHPTSEGHELLHQALLSAIRKRADVQGVLFEQETPHED
jgi:lysophospholipase L1-like esterase